MSEPAETFIGFQKAQKYQPKTKDQRPADKKFDFNNMHTVPEHELNISKKMIILEAWTFYLLKTSGKLLLFWQI